MVPSPILGPIVALVAWTLVMLIWMVATRFPAMKRAGITLKGRVGGKPGALDGVVEPNVQWKAHNYNHLMEQPTLFYAICLTLAVMDRDGDMGGLNLWLAWAYVALRIAHSLVQATTNVIRYRFALFGLASLCLIALTLHAVAYLLNAH